MTYTHHRPCRLKETLMSIGGLSVGVQTCNSPFRLRACKKRFCSCFLTLTRKKMDSILSLRAKPHFSGLQSYSEEGINSKEY